MSREELREQNKQRVVAAALEFFLEQGIENTKLKDVARRAGVTERSLYRYFAAKCDLVLSAALLFWQENVQRAQEACENNEAEQSSGAQQIEAVLQAYAELYFTARNKLVFVQEAEAYLYKNGKSSLLRTTLALAFSGFGVPLANAIHKGLADGSVKQSPDMEAMYYNAYDALLGLMQNMAVAAGDASQPTENEKKRLQVFCALLTRGLTGG